MINIKALIEKIKGKKVAVLGVGVNNVPLIRFLIAKGANVTAFDRKPASDLGVVHNELKNLGVHFSMGEHYLKRLNHKIIFKTPGIPLTVPEIAHAIESGAIVTNEIEVFMNLCPCPIIGVTGSDGKTTTSTIIAKILEAGGSKVWLGGNIGKPLIGDLDKILPNDKAVLELSSFQLQTCRVSPHIAVVTNISPNHLDYHKDMQEYIEAKKNIFIHQGENDVLVVNGDNEITNGFNGNGRLRKFSVKSEEPRAQRADNEGICYIENGEIRFADNSGDFPIINTSDILLPGMHNIENYMAAIAAVVDIAPIKAIREVAQTFRGVEHRIEFVKEVRKIAFYNDSIATSPTRTLAALNSFNKKVILIAGGYDKNIPFDDFGEDVAEHVKRLYLLGTTAKKIEAAVKAANGYDGSSLEINICENLSEAVRSAWVRADEGDIILFSPACASFDAYRNFEERGKHFKRIVEGVF